MQRKKIMVMMLVALLVVTMGTGVSAKKKVNYPRRPIEMVIPFGAGGASDIFA